jgi:hypothetical protein
MGITMFVISSITIEVENVFFVHRHQCSMDCFEANGVQRVFEEQTKLIAAAIMYASFVERANNGTDLAPK